MRVAKSDTFGARLQQLREAAGLTQYRLAQVTGVSADAIALLEKNKRGPSWDTVKKLAKGLGVTVLAFDVEPPSEPDTPAADPPPAPSPIISKRK